MDYYKRNAKTNRLYRIYKSMKQRCYNPRTPNYQIYGKRGIRICNEWLNDYDAFCKWSLAHGYDDSLSIDRIDTNGNYCPENCRWADSFTQMRNTTRNKYLTINGEIKTVSEWCEIYDINQHTYYGRLREGWDPIEALRVPSKGKRNLDFEYNGVTKSIPQWAKEYGMGATTLKYRLFSGWPVEKALNEPVDTNHTKQRRIC